MKDLIAITTINLTLGNSLGETIVLKDFNLNNMKTVINENGERDIYFKNLTLEQTMLVNSIITK